ncbi:unnamed protein product [Rotaria sp. Silwood2]|nr:unnamed protein product [Rotaria sp. Silwood2]CAF2520167.1 unnamed protein product [Rotaria sp. Silwood2]
MTTTMNMNAHNTTPSYMIPGHPQHVSYGQPPPISESRIDKAYVTSIRGILKFACLIASSVTIHYCRLPGQVAGGVMGIFAFIFLAANAVTIFMARRDEPTPNINNNDIR